MIFNEKHNPGRVALDSDRRGEGREVQAGGVIAVHLFYRGFSIDPFECGFDLEG